MSIRSVLLFSLILSSTGAVLFGQGKSLDKPPSFLLLGTNEGTGVTSMECSGKPPYSVITCNFAQVGIRRQSKEEFQKGRAELQQSLESTSEADLRKQTEGVRSSMKNARQRMLSPEATKTMAPEKVADMERTITQLEPLIACSTKPCIVDVMLKQYDANENTCTISTNTFASEFRRTGPHKWISNPGPQGICNIVYVQTLENEADSPTLWTFTQVNTTVDKGRMCEGFVINQPIVYSWHASSDLVMNCQIVKFGLF